MIDLAFFRGEADEARRVLDGMGRLASERAGKSCTFSFASALSDADVARVLELEIEAFEAPDVAFTAHDLREVMADPEALFLRFDVDGRMEGCVFGYWEWPEQVTVPGTDFFFDSAMVSAEFRSHGTGSLMIAGLLLLADLLECERVGIAAWTGSPRARRLVRAYRRFGFVRTMGDAGANTPMVAALNDETLARCLVELQLDPEGWPLPDPAPVWPRADERALLGRFYVAIGVSEALYLILPFEFAYLYLTLDRPDWAVGVTMCGIVSAMIAAIPGGIIADRWSRRATAVIGAILVGAGLIALPFMMDLAGRAQLLAACATFVVLGTGEAFVEGSTEAWVVDNLQSFGRPDLVEPFFGRVRSVSAAGATIAATIALVLLMTLRIGESLLDALWFVGGIGFLGSALLVARIPEERHATPSTEGGVWPHIGDALRAMAGRRALLMLVVAIVLGVASGAATQEAFTVALITRQFDARFFAPLSIIDSLNGTIAPIIGLAVARRMGARRMLSVTLFVEGALALLLFVSGGIGMLVALYVALDLLDDAWDPVALARMQKLTPSAHRATVNGVVYQLGALAELVAVGAFGWMLGANREALERATPDLIEAFSGVKRAAPTMPPVFLGLSIPNLAIVLFVSLAAVGVPFVMASRRSGGGKRSRSRPRPPHRHSSPTPPRPREKAPAH